MAYLSQHRWTQGGREYETNNFYYSDVDAWTYELYQLPGEPGRNDYVEIRIPDLTPDGAFTPAPADEVQFLSHGEPVIPLQLILRLVELAREYGHLPTL